MHNVLAYSARMVHKSIIGETWMHYLLSRIGRPNLDDLTFIEGCDVD